MRMTENESRNNRESRLPINFSTSRSSNGGRKMYKAERPFPNGASNPTRVNRASFVNRNCQLSLVVAIHPTHSYGGRASAPPTIWATRTLPLPFFPRGENQVPQKRQECRFPEECSTCGLSHLGGARHHLGRSPLGTGDPFSVIAAWCRFPE